MSLHSHNYNCGSDECLIIPQGYPEKKKAYIATQGDTFTKLLLFHLPYSFLSYYFHHTFALSLALFLSLLLSLTSFSFILALLHSLLLTLLTLPILPLHSHYLCYSFFLFFFLPSFSTLPHVGPTELTANRFWEMVWDYQIPTIVMLTRCVEDSKVC